MTRVNRVKLHKNSHESVTHAEFISRINTFYIANKSSTNVYPCQRDTHSSRKEHLTTLVKKKKTEAFRISPPKPGPIPQQYSSRSDFYENASPSPHDRWLLSSQSIESDRRVHRISTNFFPPWPIIFYGYRQRWKELSRVESRSRWPVYWAQLPPSLPLSLSCRPMGNAFTLEYTRQPPSCASIQPADMCRINYISVNGLSAELAWTGSRGPRVSNHSGPLFLVRCAPG